MRSFHNQGFNSVTESNEISTEKTGADLAINKIDCGNTIDITRAKHWREQFLAELSKQKPILLEAKNLTRVDTAGLQLLTAFIHKAKQAGLTVEWAETSPALVDAATVTGLLEALELTPAA